ncbi:hypothetical protein [Streptomyces sp. NPDC000410]|uniref:hypothetical protein n=1 Tax=Streptomyces sp. NPDC000410 TaxID=3154254 RepID=UPI00331C805A
MNPENPEDRAHRLLELIGEHRESIRACLNDEQHELLVTRVRALADAPEGVMAIRRALRGVEFALRPLPLEHPVRLAVDTGVRLTEGAAGAHTAVQARELLVRLTEPAPGPAATPDPHPDQDAGRNTADVTTDVIVATVQRRLLAAPSLSPQEVRARCADDPPPELIRLDDPVRGDRYPAFQFTGRAGGPIAVVRQVNRLLLADVDPWGAADWWLSGNLWLGGPPASLLGEVPDEVLSGAARALVEGDR